MASVETVTASVAALGTGVALGSITTGGAIGWVGDWVVTAAGAHEANRRASRLKLSKTRVLIVISFRKFISGNSYEKIKAE
jgi:hypothetical protein